MGNLPTDVNKGAHCTVGDHAFLSSLSLQSPGLGLEPLFHWAKFAARMLERFLLFRAETFRQPITLLNSYFCANNFTKWKTCLSCWVLTPYYFASTLNISLNIHSLYSSTSQDNQVWIAGIMKNTNHGESRN